MNTARLLRNACLSVAAILCGAPTAHAQTPPAGAPAHGEARRLEAVKGDWVRSDGPYGIAIRAIDEASGKLDASYTNPRPLPFAHAAARLDGEAVRLALELRAGGYEGSLYTLVYDPATDTLRGTFFQAPSRQQYPVVFQRRR